MLKDAHEKVHFFCPKIFTNKYFFDTILTNMLISMFVNKRRKNEQKIWRAS